MASFWGARRTFWRHLNILGSLWVFGEGFWGRGRNFTYFLRTMLPNFEYPTFWKVEKMFKQQCPKSGVEKVWTQSRPETAKCLIRAVNTICCERSDILHLDVFYWGPFCSIFLTFSQNMWLHISKNTHATNKSKFDEQVCCARASNESEWDTIMWYLNRREVTLLPTIQDMLETTINYALETSNIHRNIKHSLIPAGSKVAHFSSLLSLSGSAVTIVGLWGMLLWTCRTWSWIPVGDLNIDPHS